jgi:hypothetical protein
LDRWNRLATFSNAVVYFVADTAAPTDAEEDDELGDDEAQMWLEALSAAEPTSEPMVRTVAESDSDDDL